MSRSRSAPATTLYQPPKDLSAARLFVELDKPTLAWLTERAQGRALGSVASEVLRTVAQAEGG